MIINKRQWIHRITAVLLIVMAGMAATVQMTSAAENSSAKKSENTSTSLKEAQQEKAALEKALEKAKQTINELKESKGDVQAKVNDLNTQLMNISSRITALENQLAQKNQELTEKKDQIEDTKDQLEDAKKQAESILAEAKKTADELNENTKSELKLFAGQAVNALKTEVANLLTNQTVEETVKGFTADKEFLYKFILALAEKWSANEPIEISVKDADSLKKYFTAKAKALLDKGVTINQVNGMKMLFSISPADGSYKVNFGEEEFENYFKEFLRPQLVKMLF